MRFARLFVCVGLLFGSWGAGVAVAQDQGVRQEEDQDYFRKWLTQDVVYIISNEERAIFNQLRTAEEKEQFIEQFWFRRDPDPRTAFNEFKEEHYRRIAYANEKFTSGDPGWLTDRGRTYILFGPPDGIESRPTGGVYMRTIQEGGGSTSVHPFEKWRYRRIEGIGDDIELEFVDTTGTGAFHLAVFDWEKDLGTWVGEGPTLAETLGIAKRSDRPGMAPAAGGSMSGPQNWYRRYNDTPFNRYERFARVTSLPVTKYTDLKELVKVDIRFDNLPFEAREEYFRLNEFQTLVPITIQVSNSDVTFEERNGQQMARMAVYGIVSTMTNRIITEFEDDFVVRYSPDEFEAGLRKQSVYQRIIPLETRNLYKVDLVVKDLATGKTGVVRKRLAPPRFEEEQLQGSSLILTDQIQALPEIPEDNPMFVIGDVRVLPRLNGEFTRDMPLGIYYQVYNAGLDQASLSPDLRVAFNLVQDGRYLRSAVDESGESTQFSSGQRVVLVKKLTLDGLEPGKYQIEIEVTDRITGRVLKQTGDFSVVEG